MSNQHATELTITRPDDWHLHLRDGSALEAVVLDTARQFARAIVMPNLRPPVTTTEQALAYRARIEAALRKAGGDTAAFTPLMTLYLTDNTPAEEIVRAHESGQVAAVKLYPAGATTNSDAGVTDLLGKCGAALAALERCGMPLLVHGEVTDPAIDVFDREAVFIERVMQPLRRAYPGLKVVFEHITTREGAHYVRDAEGPTAATITPQHMLYNRNAIFTGGVRPHWYCLPILKRNTHQQALREAVASGSEKFFLGTDSAPHAKHRKESSCGCAGVFNAQASLSAYATVFEELNALDKLEAFCSLNGPRFYGLPVNEGTLELHRQPIQFPEEIVANEETIIPFLAGQSLNWSVA